MGPSRAEGRPLPLIAMEPGEEPCVLNGNLLKIHPAAAMRCFLLSTPLSSAWVSRLRFCHSGCFGWLSSNGIIEGHFVGASRQRLPELPGFAGFSGSLPGLAALRLVRDVL